MRFLMRIRMPSAGENPELAALGFQEKMRALLLKVNALSANCSVTDGQRVDHIIVDVEDPAQLPAIAEPFFRWLKVVPEFLHELTPEQAQDIKPRAEAV